MVEDNEHNRKSQVIFPLRRDIKTIDDVFAFVKDLSKVCGCEESEIEGGFSLCKKYHDTLIDIDELFAAAKKYLPREKAEAAIEKADRLFVKKISVTSAYNFLNGYMKNEEERK